MNIFQRLWGRIKQMFDRTTIETVIGEKPELTTSMIDHIDLWQKMLAGNAPWITGNVKSIGIETSICQEFADVTLSEMDVHIDDTQLQKQFDDGTRDLPQNLISGLAVGSFVLRPIGEMGTEFVTPDKFIPIRFDLDGKPCDIAFIDIRQIDDAVYYLRLERHKLEDGNLIITNRAYRSATRYGFDTPIPLSTVSDWANLDDGVIYPGMDRMDFGYYRNPIKNQIDDSPCGISIYDSATELIRRADIQAARLDWEFESGERAIHVDDRMIREQGDGHYSTAKLNKRLYRGLYAEDGDKPLIETYSPEFRDASIVNGLEQCYRQIERSVGLAYGDLSNVNEVERTATEVKSARFRKYNRVAAIERNLRTCLTDYIDALAFYGGKFTTLHEVTINFHDNVLTDEDAERLQDRQDLAAGIMQPWEYRMKWYNEDEKTAKKILADGGDDTTEVIE